MRDGRVLFTLAEAASRLDPPISLRTLRRIVAVAGLEHHGLTEKSHRPAKLFDSSDLDYLHAAWVRGEVHG